MQRDIKRLKRSSLWRLKCCNFVFCNGTHILHKWLGTGIAACILRKITKLCWHFCLFRFYFHFTRALLDARTHQTHNAHMNNCCHWHKDRLKTITIYWANLIGFSLSIRHSTLYLGITVQIIMWRNTNRQNGSNGKTFPMTFTISTIQIETFAWYRAAFKWKFLCQFTIWCSL